MMAQKKRVLVGMSGGVDSSVTALLLKQAGYEVIGVTMRISQPPDSTQISQPADFFQQQSRPASIPPAPPASTRPGRRLSCFGDDEDEEIKEAEAVAHHIGIPFYVVDLHQEYEARILSYFREEYARGRTPNPCVKCNAEIKFGLLLEGCRKLGLDYDYFATGHYARVKYDKRTGRWLLLKARDASKDQSYFLSLLSQEQLARALFPLGDLTKAEVRKIAREHDLPVSDKEESQDFYAGDYRELLKKGTPGPIKDLSGRILGHHNGIENYTIGQRRGLGIPSTGRLYVVRIDAATNTVYIGEEKDLLTQKFCVDYVNWIARIPVPGEEIEATVKVRYKSPELACRLKTFKSDGQVVSELSERTSGDDSRVEGLDRSRVSAPDSEADIFKSESISKSLKNEMIRNETQAAPDSFGPVPEEPAGQESHSAIIGSGVSGVSPDSVEVTLLSPYKAITPGQVAVFYDGEAVLGAGFIKTSDALHVS